jgi:hypothetical protein
MNQLFKLKSLPPPLLLIIFSHSVLQVSAASDYSIASFDSSADLGLSPACDTVYRKPIPSCQPYDFNAINPCSSLCIESLQSIQTEAQVTCSSQSIPVNSMLAYFRGGTGVDQLCSVMKNVVATTTLVPQVSPSATQTTNSGTVPAGAGGVSYATEAAADQSAAEGMALSKGALLAIVIGVVVGSVILLLVSIMLYRRHYRK